VYLPAKLEKDPAGHDVQAKAPVSRQTERIDQMADRDTDISIKPDSDAMSSLRGGAINKYLNEEAQSLAHADSPASITKPS
jgi:hypothetical protein